MPVKKNDNKNSRGDAVERSRRRQRILFVILAAIIILTWVLSLIVRY